MSKFVHIIPRTFVGYTDDVSRDQVAGPIRELLVESGLRSESEVESIRVGDPVATILQFRIAELIFHDTALHVAVEKVAQKSPPPGLIVFGYGISIEKREFDHQWVVSDSESIDHLVREAFDVLCSSDLRSSGGSGEP